MLDGLGCGEKASIERGHSFEVLHDLGSLFGNAVDGGACFAARRLADDFEDAVEPFSPAPGFRVRAGQRRLSVLFDCAALAIFGRVSEINVFQSFMKEIFKLLGVFATGCSFVNEQQPIEGAVFQSGNKVGPLGRFCQRRSDGDAASLSHRQLHPCCPENRLGTSEKKPRAAVPGLGREWLIRKARQAETVAHVYDWVKSPGLRPPAQLRHAPPVSVWVGTRSALSSKEIDL